MPIESRPSEELPGFAAAFDEEAMRRVLQPALFGTKASDYVVERCSPTRPLYTPGESCLLRYRLRARHRGSGEIVEPIVTGRVFPNRSTCAAYMSEKLAPLVARMRGRPEVAAFAAPAALIEPLNMVVQVWPVAGELPTLVEATDRDRILVVLRETLPETLGRPFEVEDCRLELVSYRRRQRCVLRYTVMGRDATHDDLRSLVAYGKVSAIGNDTPKDVILGELRRRLLERGVPPGLTVPRSLGWRPELQLSLLEAVSGEASIGPALEARVRGEPPPGALSLEEMVGIGGDVAAALHTSRVTLGPARTLGDEVAGLAREVAMFRGLTHFGPRTHAWLNQIAALGERSEPLPLSVSHGDFKHEQLLFDGARSALVDFDAICQAEPALDLGKFLAHLRVKTRRAQQRASAASPLGEELAEHVIRTYVAATGERLEDEERLRERTAVYEAVALLRLVLRSQQDLDESRLEVTTSLLEASLAELEQR